LHLLFIDPVGYLLPGKLGHATFDGYLLQLFEGESEEVFKPVLLPQRQGGRNVLQLLSLDGRELGRGGCYVSFLFDGSSFFLNRQKYEIMNNKANVGGKEYMKLVGGKLG